MAFDEMSFIAEGELLVNTPITLPNDFVDLSYFMQVGLSVQANDAGNNVLDISEEKTFTVFGGRIPKKTMHEKFLPVSNQVLDINDAEDGEVVTFAGNQFGVAQVLFWDADFRRERIKLVVDPKIRFDNGNPVAPTLAIKVGETVRLSFYAGFRFEVSWNVSFALSSLISYGSTFAPTFNMTGTSVGSGTLQVNGLFSTTQTITVNVLPA